MKLSEKIRASICSDVVDDPKSTYTTSGYMKVPDGLWTKFTYSGKGIDGVIKEFAENMDNLPESTLIHNVILELGCPPTSLIPIDEASELKACRKYYNRRKRSDEMGAIVWIICDSKTGEIEDDDFYFENDPREFDLEEGFEWRKFKMVDLGGEARATPDINIVWEQECVKCKGKGEYTKTTNKYLDGSESYVWVDCSKCKGKQVITRPATTEEIAEAGKRYVEFRTGANKLMTGEILDGIHIINGGILRIKEIDKGKGKG